MHEWLNQLNEWLKEQYMYKRMNKRAVQLWMKKRTNDKCKDQ